MDPGMIAMQVRSGKSVVLPDYTLEPEEILIETSDREGKAAASSGGYVVAIETKIAPHSIDGKSIPNLKDNFRVQSTVFGFTFPDTNIFTYIETGDYPADPHFPAVDDGYYVMLKPLPVGPHKIQIKGTLCKGLPYEFKIDITYNIIVE